LFNVGIKENISYIEKERENIHLSISCLAANAIKFYFV